MEASHADRSAKDWAVRWEFAMDETKIDREAMGRLAKASAFICGADHPESRRRKWQRPRHQRCTGVVPQTEAERPAGGADDAGPLRPQAQCRRFLRGNTAPVLARVSSSVASAIRR